MKGKSGGRIGGRGPAPWRIGGLLAAALTLAASALQGQVPVDTARIEAVERLRPGSAVRFTVAGRRGIGVLEEVAGRGLLVRTDRGDGVARLAPARLDSLWVRGDAAGPGAALGMVLGLVPVVALCGDGVDECGLVPNGLLLVGASAAVGYWVGRGLESWTRILPE